MNLSKREFLQVLGAAGVAGMALGRHADADAQQAQNALYDTPRFGNVSLLHMTDCHAQLLPIHFREPDVNLGIGPMAGQVPHLVGDKLLRHFGIRPGTPEAHAFTYLDFVKAAKTYGKVGGFAHLATLVKQLKASRPGALLLDGGDTWQGSYSALKTNGQDMVDCMKLLKPDAMVGHWEFTLGEARVKEIIDTMGYPFLASNVFDAEWDEPVFENTIMLDKGGVRVAIIGQAMPYTPIANPKWMFPKWSFGIRPEVLQANVDKARADGAQVVVVLSHNGFDVDQKLATILTGVNVILTGHTHDAVPRAIEIGKTLVLSSGSHGKYLGRIDLDVSGGEVTGYSSGLIPVFADVIEPDKEMAAKIAEVRAPFEAETSRVIGKTEGMLYRRGNFNGTWDDLICAGLIEERDAEISLSPGFRWGSTLLPGDDITVDDLYNQTAMSYPNAYRLNFTGAQIKDILEDVCDNLFNTDPFFQQGGDMVRVGGMGYTCSPKASIGSRISDMTVLKTGEALDPAKSYVVAGWASVNQGVEGPAIYDLMEKFIAGKGAINQPVSETVKVEGM